MREETGTCLCGKYQYNDYSAAHKACHDFYVQKFIPVWARNFTALNDKDVPLVAGARTGEVRAMAKPTDEELVIDGQARDKNEMVMIRVPKSQVQAVYDLLDKPPKQSLTPEQREAVFFSLLDDALDGKISGKEAVDFINGELGVELIQWDEESQGLRMSSENARVIRQARDELARKAMN